jgi:hypothetical protein
MLALNACSVAPLEEELAQKSSNLFLTGKPWPDKLARVCWDDTTRQRGDFAVQSVVMQSAANRMYTQATGLQFSDWGACPAETAGMIVTKMLTNQQSSCATVDNEIGYVATKPTICSISTGNAAIMHEFGHALGFGHEWYRPDWTLSCPRIDPRLSGNTLGTPVDDVNSVMAAMHYCTSKQRIDYWDVVGAQKVYGFPNMFADVSGDGKADALVVRADGVYVRTANTANTGFNTEANWAPNGPRYGDKGTFLADVSGDAKADLVLINDTGIIVRRANTAGSPSFTAGNKYTGGPFWGTLETHVADVTGDCLADVIAINDNETYVRDAVPAPPFVEAGSFGPGWTLGPSRVGGFGHTVFANVSHSGAGKGCWADAIYIDADGVWVATSDGTTLSTAVKWINGGPSIRPIGYAMRAVLVDDVTQDGLADIVEVGNDEIYVWRSLGNAFSDPPEVWNSQGIGQVADRGVFLADVTNDLRADLILVGPDRIRVAKSNGSAFPSYSFWTSSPYYGSQLMF